jgi:hypothetical protein
MFTGLLFSYRNWVVFLDVCLVDGLDEDRVSVVVVQDGDEHVRR